MRKIRQEAPDTPKWRRWRKDCKAETEAVAEAVARGEIADENDDPVVLRDEDGKIIRDENGQTTPHPGYYWLAYDWRNLLPACALCNQPSTIDDQKIGKHNRFPVVGRHAWTPEEQKTEKPLLIHPGSGAPEDDPEAHLSIDTETGLMKGATDRGRMCIEVFGLNQREGLIADRRRSSREVLALVNRFLYNREERAEVVREIASIRTGERPFTMAQMAMLSELQPLFASIIEDE